MKYVANPVEVDAFRIASVEKLEDGRYLCRFEVALDQPINQSQPALGIATPDMTARMIPKVDDYWVIQSDGYVYLNPKEVFERKYSPIEATLQQRAAS